MLEKFGRARQATDDNTIRRMRFVCWIPKATDTNSEQLFHGNNGFANAPQCYDRIYIAGLVFAVCCVSSGLCDGLISRSEEFYLVHV
jgi:hypothetical protein